MGGRLMYEYSIPRIWRLLKIFTFNLLFLRDFKQHKGPSSFLTNLVYSLARPPMALNITTNKLHGFKYYYK